MQIVALALEKTQLKVMLKERVPDIAVKVENSLVDKYCYLEYINVFNHNRTRALKVQRGHGRLTGVNPVNIHLAHGFCARWRYRLWSQQASMLWVRAMGYVYRWTRHFVKEVWPTGGALIVSDRAVVPLESIVCISPVMISLVNAARLAAAVGRHGWGRLWEMGQEHELDRCRSPRETRECGTDLAVTSLFILLNSNKHYIGIERAEKSVNTLTARQPVLCRICMVGPEAGLRASHARTPV